MVQQFDTLLSILEKYKNKREGGRVRFLTTTGVMIPFEFPPVKNRPFILPSEKMAILKRVEYLLS